MRFFRGRLPHWLVAERPYFVTICRKGCLPLAVLTELRRRREGAAAEDERGGKGDGWRDEFQRFDAALDASDSGLRDMATPAVAAAVLGNLQWLRDRGWRIWACCVMPTHVHMVLRNEDGGNGRLTEDLGRYKNFTGREANRLLGLSGRYWQRESFDHWCRTPERWLGFVAYSARNPVQAGLARHWRDWPWTVADPTVAEILDRAEADGEGGGLVAFRSSRSLRATYREDRRAHSARRTGE